MNVQTGERVLVELTDAEIADAHACKAAEDARFAVADAAAARKTARQAKLDALLDKIEVDPTILTRL